jgi:hypothetical protein
MPISTFPRHDYDEDEYLLKPAGLRDTHSEGKVRRQIEHLITMGSLVLWLDRL